MADTQTVQVQSTFLSKINWTQAVAAAAMLFTLFGHTVPPETQAAVLGVITGLTTVITWVLRTFFTNTVTPSAAAGLTPTGLAKK